MEMAGKCNGGDRTHPLAFGVLVGISTTVIVDGGLKKRQMLKGVVFSGPGVAMPVLGTSFWRADSAAGRGIKAQHPPCLITDSGGD